MHRDVACMARTEHDVVVVGGGVHGACAAWEAARRGLRVALVEAVDFGHATTSNSLRTFHGGIRYLQQLDFRRMPCPVVGSTNLMGRIRCGASRSHSRRSRIDSRMRRKSSCCR